MRDHPIGREGLADSFGMFGQTELNLMLCLREVEPLANFQVTGTFVADIIVRKIMFRFESGHEVVRLLLVHAWQSV